MSLKIKVIGVNKTIKSLNSYVEKLVPQLERVVINGTKDITLSARSKAPADLGTLKSLINYTLINKRDYFQGRILSAKDSSSAVEFGTSPHWVPSRNISGWAMRHGMTTRQLKFSIAKKGTQAHPFMTPAYFENESKIIQRARRVIKAS